MLRKLLVANRGEIALRIARAAHDLGIQPVRVLASDESRHLAGAGPASTTGPTDASVTLPGEGPAAYLDIAALVRAARAEGCDALHPGYGFLSERADLAEACAAAGLTFVGPTPAQLALFGDKARARALAHECGVPLLPGTGAAALDDIAAFWAEQRRLDPTVGIMLKAVAGGGGRGMRAVHDRTSLAAAFERCRAEALAAFGVGEVYAERLIPRARHIEIQLIGDGRRVTALGDRDCTLQRRFQKLVEIAPSPHLDDALRRALTEAATRMAEASRLTSLATFEFLVDPAPGAPQPFAFIEANPRLQVEHTVTEEVTGIDLVQAQLRLAGGATLEQLSLANPPPRPSGCAIQWRLNAETLDASGQARPATGRIERCEWPNGPGVRVDTHAAAGLAVSARYDTLLAKLIVGVRSGDFDAALRRSQRALDECRIDGLATTLPLLRVLAHDPALREGRVHTRWLEAEWPRLNAALASPTAATAAADIDTAAGLPSASPARDSPVDRTAPGPDVPIGDRTPKAFDAPAPPLADRTAEGLEPLRAPLAGRVVALPAAHGETLGAGADAVVLEAMKMQHGVAHPTRARLHEMLVEEGEVVEEGQLLAWVEPLADRARAGDDEAGVDPDHLRADLRRVLDRRASTLDAARPEAMARRHASGGRSARENLADLCDPGSFDEYGAFAIAAQTRRRPRDDLIANTPADGMVTGTGTVNAALFGPERSRCVLMAYDYTVLAGTQGMRNHAKTDRLLGVAHRLRLPTVLFAEGGGGRPGDTDHGLVAGLNNHTFTNFAALSGKVPVVGIVHGRCFAGNAALVGCSDVIIATRGSNLGMGGPAMIEGGGLGVHPPEAIGPSAVQHANGVIDVLVEDEAEATATARRYLAYFQGPTRDASSADPRLLRHLVPEGRLRAYDMRRVIDALADTGSVLELRRGFGRGMVTALARFEGRPVGLVANDPLHLGGAIDPPAADKAARFLRLCDAHGLPIVSLCDTPGFMVGPEVERDANVRRACGMFLAAAHLRVPCFTVVVRKGYGLGAQAMALGGFDAPVFTVAWPTAEFGAMGLEGAVKLGYRKELEAATKGEARGALYRSLVARQYEDGSALNMASVFEIDAVIDPAETRGWIVRGLEGTWRGTPARTATPLGA